MAVSTHLMLAIAIGLYSTAVTAQKLGPLHQVDYVKYAEGAVINASETIFVPSVSHCGAICTKRMVCPAFSVSRQNGSNTGSATRFPQAMECRIAIGADYSWGPDPSSALFAERTANNMTGYVFGTDGMFYRVFPTELLNASASRARCIIAEGGNLAVPHPKFRFDAIMDVLGASRATYHVGIFSAGSGKWVTDDGNVFVASSSDPNQIWLPNEPYGSSNVAILTPNNNSLTGPTIGLANGDPKSLHALLCRRGGGYRQMSPPTGKYYRAYYEWTDWNAAAAKCLSDGGTLAQFIRSDLEFSTMLLFRTLLKTFPTNLMGYQIAFWVGGTDQEKDGDWKFPDGAIFNVSTILSDPSKARFIAAGELKGTPNENCLGLSSSSLGLFDIVCNRALWFICEIAP